MFTGEILYKYRWRRRDRRNIHYLRELPRAETKRSSKVVNALRLLQVIKSVSKVALARIEKANWSDEELKKAHDDGKKSNPSQTSDGFPYPGASQTQCPPKKKGCRRTRDYFPREGCCSWALSGNNNKRVQYTSRQVAWPQYFNNNERFITKPQMMGGKRLQ